MAEWLRRLTRNQFRSAGVGSNPTDRESFFQSQLISIIIMTQLCLPRLAREHRWFSGRMLACHAGGPGSIPGRCMIFLTFFASKQMQHEYHYDLFLLSPMQRKLTYFEYNNSREGQCVANFLSPTDLPSIQLQITDQ